MEGRAPRGLPVALFVYRRHARLQRTLDCLRDSGAESLYVFSDGPGDEEAAADVARVRELVRAIDWAEPVVVERDANLGLSRSIRAGLDWLFERHDRVAVIEDDVCVAPEFCAYADAALRAYEHEQRVAGITGLRYPFPRAPLSAYPHDVFMSPRFSSWGWATWRDRWERFVFDRVRLREQLAERADLPARQAGADMPGMIERAIVKESLSGSWDVVCAANMLLRGEYFVTPTWNMVENTGLRDGTHRVRASWTLAWEPEHRPALERLRFAPVAEVESVLAAYRSFFEPTLWELAGAVLAMLARGLTGLPGSPR